MRAWLLAVAVAVLGTRASAQPVPPSLPIPPTAPAVPTAPGQLPPLLPIPLAAPVQPPIPLPEVPRPSGPAIDYDHGYQYLPEQAPTRRLADEVCGPLGKWWVNADFDLAWASTRPAPDTVRLRVPNPAAPGATLPGPRLPVSGLDAGRFEPAFSLSLGHWFDDAHTLGIDASYFVRDANTTFGGWAPGMLVQFPSGTNRSAPLITVLPPQPAGQGVVSQFPATIGTYFTTFDVNYRNNLLCTEYARLDGVVGYRYAYLGDELYLGDLPAGSSQAFRLNRAAVSNSFNAGQIGLAGEARTGRWYVTGSAKIALGVMTPEVTATGLFIDAQGRTPAGYRPLHALSPSEWNEFSAMPTLNVQVGRQLTPHARVYAGYSFYYLSRVGRLGDMLNPGNTGLPLASFWVQTIDLGAEFRF